MRLYRVGFLANLLFLALILPVTAQYGFSAHDTEGCTPMKVKYTFLSSATTDTVSSVYWDFGNGETSTLENPDSVVYENSGDYTVTLAISFTNGGEELITKPDYINVHRTVPASFVYYDSISYNVYVLNHVEPLENGATYTFNWDIEGFTNRTGRKQLVTFPSADTFTVSLTVTDNFGCSSTNTEEIPVFESISVQNVFSPNDDGFLDFFIITSNGGFPINLKIFTRTGTLVYENEGTTVTWDGKTASGQDLSPGVYFYAISALQADPNKRYSKAGVLYMYK